MQAPSGSMIAFSTTAGNTAPDGNGENSVYCKVLAKNMLIEGVNLDQVFRNTRAEVLKESGGEQRTEESTQLTGETFYLVQNTFTDELKQIDALIEEENYTEALVLAGHIVELSPKNKIAHYKKARVYSYLEKNKSALHSLDKAYELDSNYVKIYNLRGIIYVEQKKYDLAIKEYERGIALKEIDPEGAAYCYRFRAEQYERLREYDKALADYDSAIVLQPENADRYYNRAWFYYEQKEYNKSIVDYVRATELDPDDSENWRMLGYVYQNGIKDYEKALGYYEKSLEVDSTYVNSINSKALIYVEQKKYDLAIKEYSKGILLKEIDPEGAAYCYRNRAEQYERLREYDKALADYDSAIALEPENVNRYNYRALFYYEQKEYNKSIVDFTRATELDPDGAGNWRMLGYVYKNGIKDYEKALGYYEKSLEVDSTYVNSINSKALIYVEQKKYDLAIKEYSKGILLKEIDPEGAAYCYRNRAEQYERLREYDKALADYDSAIALEPENVNRYNDRAWFYSDIKKDYDLAFIDITKAIELAPDDPNNYNARADFYKDYSKYDLALTDYAKAIELNSNIYQTARAINNRALIYEELGEIKLAIDEFSKILTSTEIKNEIGDFYTSKVFTNRAGDWELLKFNDSALLDYTKAIDYDNSNADKYSDRALFYYEQKEYNKSIVDFTRATELDPDDSENWRMLGYVYQNGIKDYEKALDYYEKSLEVDSTYVLSINSRALIYVEQKKYDLAIKEYERGIALKEIDPKGAAYCYSNRAEQYERLREYDKALADYDSAIVLQPENADRYYNRALFYYEQKEYNKSIVDFTRATELDPDDSENWRMLGYVYKNGIKDYEKALDYYEKSLEVDSTYVNSINSKALIYVEQKKYDLAIKEYERGIALKEIDPEGAAYCYSNRAEQYERLREYDKALADYDSAIVLQPENADRYYNRAWFYYEQKEYNMSIVDFTEATELDPDDSENWRMLGYVYKNGIKDYEKALDYYEKSLEVDSTYVLSINNKANIYVEQKKYDLAIKEYERGIALKEIDPEGAAFCYINRATQFERLREYDKALADYDSAIALEPENAFRYISRAWFHFKIMQNLGEAENDYNKAIAVEKNDEVFYNKRARFYMQTGQNQKALKDYNKAIELDNEQINGYNSRGFYYYLTGDSLKAIKDYNVVLNKDTNDTDIYFGMAYIYEKQNKFEDAKKMYDLAITKDLDDPQGYYHLAKFYHTKNSLFKALRKFDKAIDKLKGVGDYSIYNKKGLEVYEYEIHLELYEIYKNDFEDLEEACDELQKAKSSFEEDIDALIYHPDALSEIEALIKSNCQR